MSLVQHVSAIDGIDRDAAESVADIDELPPIRRRISYDLFPPAQPGADDKPGLAPYNVSVARRLAQVAATVLACWLASGLVFGFAALKPVLIDEGVYRELCTADELRDGAEVCSKQDLKLNLFFTVGSITANVSALPVGTILDRYGSRVCGFAGCALLSIGSLLMSLSFSRRGFEGYIAGNLFLALGGTFIFVPSFQIANAFPRHQGTVVALVTGAFDASAAVYLFYRLAWQRSHKLTPDVFFLGYLAVPALICVALLTFMPRQDYKSSQQLEIKVEKAQDASRDVHDSDDEIADAAELRRVRQQRAAARRAKMRQLDNVLGDEDERRHRVEQEEERHAAAAVWGVLHGQPAGRQMASPWFVLITLMTVLQMLRMNYFIATIRAQYEYMLGSDLLAARINGFFDAALPAVGLLSTPLIGFLLDRTSVPAMLAAIVVLTTAVGALNCVPAALWAAYATVLLFVFLRPLYYSAMSDYATKVFGFATFGRVYGTIICVSGLVNFSQYALDALTHGLFAGNPIPINAALAVAGFVVGCFLVAFVSVRGRHIRAAAAAAAAEPDRQPLLHEYIFEEDEDEDD